MLFVEISNFTKDCLKGEDLSIINGDSDPLIFWQSEEDENILPAPILLKNFKSFLIPPYGKERLVFRCSKSTTRYKSRLTGLMAMQIGENNNKKMMLRFRIDGGNAKSSYNSFSVGFPDLTTSSTQILEDIKKTKREDKKNQAQQNYFDTIYQRSIEREIFLKDSL